MADCPSKEQLIAYAHNDCDEAEFVAIGMHVEQCPRCREEVEQAQAGDTILGGLRDVWGSQAQAGQAADQPTIPAGTPVSPAFAAAGPTSILAGGIAGYEILEELGRGGMGVVYLAMQQSTKRKVALKVLLEGPFASSEAKKRFEREVELAAQLHHPYIVTILESGIASGQYYFAMEYAEGRRLDQYITGRSPSPNEILKLFSRICGAVNHAHQRGVIHRDLKPSNILIDEEDNPHILDFGLAKIYDDSRESREESLALSMPGQVMGTLPYMSPEQAAGDHHNVDVRSDVYSMGVILYEAMTGQYPYQVTGKLHEILRNITEVQPAKPSGIRPAINNEIETIVLKALAKERERRYQSMDALAGDIDRYLRGDPIEAKRDSSLYILRKMVSRYRVPLAAAAAFLLVVGASLIVMLNQRVGLRRAAAEGIITLFVDDDPQRVKLAFTRLNQAPASISDYLVENSARYLFSSASIERVMGARSGVFANPEAFWRSVDEGPLWPNGEWLELCSLPKPVPDQLIYNLREKAVGGTDRQKYVAYCLIGQLAEADDHLAELCVRAAESQSEPGVVLAAAWAAQRLGRPVKPRSNERIFVDDNTRLVFVRIPGSESFRRGSDPSDPDRFPDEEKPTQGVPIPEFYISTTEITLALIPTLLDDPESIALFGGDVIEGMKQQLDVAGDNDPGRVALGRISLNTARRYCDWLNDRAATLRPRRRYRLPSEDEWEYACHGANIGRFCFGNDARYAWYFANCNASVWGLHLVARHMPNWYGLFDMHGGLWERCETRYPAKYIDNPELADRELWVQKGGAYYSPAVRCRCAQRNFSDAWVGFDYDGFRLVLEFLES